MSVQWTGHCQKNSVCSKHEKLRHWRHCIALPPINQSSNILTCKTANIHEKIEYENLIFQNNSLGPLLFLASSTSSSSVPEWHQMSILPTWTEYMKTAAVLVTKHVTQCTLISHKMEVSQSGEMTTKKMRPPRCLKCVAPICQWCDAICQKQRDPHLSSHLNIISQCVYIQF